MNEHKLAYRVYRPEKEVKAAAFIVHGMEEHQGRYVPLASILTERGIGCVTYDLPGHKDTAGSEADKGWFGEKDGWKNLVHSAVDIAQLTKREFPGVPLIYFGHSMGTMIGRVFLENYDGLIDGCILSGAPNYNPGASAGKLLAEAVKLKEGARGHSALLDNLATGAFNNSVKNPRTPVDWLSYNEENVDNYIKDEWCGFPFTVQGYIDLFELMQKMHKVSLYKCTRPDLPLYLFAGEDDPCIGGEKGFASTVDTLRKAGYSNITTRIYANMRHETMNETDGSSVMKDAADWILENC